MNDPVLTQPIAVVPGSHEDTVAAVALASALTVAAHGRQEPYLTWLSASFAKSVRRTKAHRLARCGDPVASVTIGEATAWAFDPCLGMSRPLKRLQVSGLDALRTGRWRDLDGPQVRLNRQVVMTTGKAAAQAAHALCGWVTTLDDAALTRWMADPRFGLAEADFATLGRPVVTICDNGRTEVEPGTRTAGVWM